MNTLEQAAERQRSTTGPVSGHAGRRTQTMPRDAESAAAARAATVTALTQVLEVLDGRRPCEHLLHCVTDEVYTQVTALLRKRRRAPSTEAARLMRVHLQIGAAGRASYFGTFVRERRIRAIAGRTEIGPACTSVKRSLGRPEDRWVLAELSIV